MIKFAPILLAVLYGLVMYYFSMRRTHTMLDENSTPLRDPHLENLTNKMAMALDLDRIKVNVYEIEPVNGLAVPDGRIFITRGFLNKYRDGLVDGAEMASVIAHELGHVALGHTKRRIIDFSGQNALRTAMAMILGRLIPGLGIYIANAMASMIAARLSRNDEYAADQYASALLIKSGIGTAGQKSLFNKLDGLTGANGKPLAWLASHPAAEERIAAITKNEEKWQN